MSPIGSGCARIETNPPGVNSGEKTVFGEAVSDIMRSALELKGVIICSAIGFPLSFQVPPGMNAAEIASICSAVHSAVCESTVSIGMGKPNYWIISLETVIVASFDVGSSFIIIAIMEKQAELDAILNHVHKAIQKICNSLLFL